MVSFGPDEQLRRVLSGGMLPGSVKIAMGYDAKPTVEDAVLFADPRSVSNYVVQMMRIGVAGLGDTIKEWREAEIHHMLDLMVVRKYKLGSVTAEDATFACALKFCLAHRLAPLHQFKRTLAKAVADADDRLDAAYEALDMDKLLGAWISVEEAAIGAASPGAASFSHLSVSRLQDVQRSLVEEIKSDLSAHIYGFEPYN